MENRRQKTTSDKQLSLSPGFWDDTARATTILKDIKLAEFWLNLYESVEASVEDFAVLYEFWKEGEGTEDDVKAAYDKAVAAVEEAEFKSTLNEPEDELPA